MTVAKILAAKKSMVPKAGANVVGVDTFEPPGEGLYLIKHFDSVEDADRYAAAYRKKHPSERVYVYTPETA